MPRVSEYLRNMVTMEELSVAETERAMASVESDLIVLEGLEVCADELGTYTATAKHSEAPISPELRNKSALWLDKAEAVSQGRTDINTYSEAGSPSLESLRVSLESEDKKNIFRRIWEAIKALALRIYKFLRSFFVKTRAEKVAFAAKDIEEHLSRVRHKRPTKNKITLSGQPLHMFSVDGKTPKSANDILTVLNRTEQVFDVLSREYCAMVGDTQQDLTHTLKAAFESDFKDESKNSDLYRALKTFDPAKLATKVGGTEDAPNPHEESTEHKDRLKTKRTKSLCSGKAVFFTYLDEGFLSRLMKSKPLDRIRALTASSVVMQQVTHRSTGEADMAVLDTPTIERLAKAAKTIAEVAERNVTTVKRLQEYQESLDRVFEDCLMKDVDDATTDAGKIVSSLASTMCRRMVHPLMELQQLSLGGAHAALEICQEHLDAYE